MPDACLPPLADVPAARKLYFLLAPPLNDEWPDGSKTFRFSERSKQPFNIRFPNLSIAIEQQDPVRTERQGSFDARIVGAAKSRVSSHLDQFDTLAAGFAQVRPPLTSVAVADDNQQRAHDAPFPYLMNAGKRASGMKPVDQYYCELVFFCPHIAPPSIESLSDHLSRFPADDEPSKPVSNAKCGDKYKGKRYLSPDVLAAHRCALFLQQADGAAMAAWHSLSHLCPRIFK
nr:hypothetical protein [Salaquimonas pukyongi]